MKENENNGIQGWQLKWQYSVANSVKYRQPIGLYYIFIFIRHKGSIWNKLNVKLTVERKIKLYNDEGWWPSNNNTSMSMHFKAKLITRFLTQPSTILTQRVKSAKVGCYIRTVCCSIFLYADDIILLSPTVHGLQALLNVCENYLIKIGMSINVNKSVCIRFGPRFNIRCAELVSAFGGYIKWANSCRYLGVFFISGRTLRCSFDNAKSRFFSERLMLSITVKSADSPRRRLC